MFTPTPRQSAFDTDALVDQRYRRLRPLGQGTDGAAYLARDEQTGREVALKFYPMQGSWSGPTAWQREARILENLTHPAIPAYISHEQLPSGPLLMVRGFAPGMSLAEHLAAGRRFTTEQVVVIAEQVLDALVYLQSLNPPVVHGDIKPANLVLDEQTGSLRVHLIDFAAVRETLRQREPSGLGGGSLGYAAPEQAAGRFGVTTDLYALGATLAHLLSHVHPADMPQRGLTLDFGGLVQSEAWLVTWVQKLLAPNPEDRFTNAEAARSALAAKMNGGASPGASLHHQPIGEKPSNLTAPVGTSVTVTLRGDERQLEVPGVGFFGRGVRGESVFWVLWTAHISLLTLGVLAGGPRATAIFALFLVPFWGVAVYVAMRLAFAMYGRTTLRMTADVVSVQRRLGAWVRQVQTPRAHWSGATIAEERTRRTTRKVCVVTLGVHEVRFGQKLSLVEQRWLVDLLNEWAKH